MKYSLSTFAYFKYPLIEAVKRIKEYGYDGVELWGGRPHAYWEDMTKERRQDLKKAIEDHGLEISNFIPAQFRYPTNLAAHDELIRKNSVSYIKKNIDVAVELGAPYVSLCPGFRMYGATHLEAWNCMIQSFRELAEYARKMPLHLILEPAHRYETDLVYTVNDGKRALKEINGKMGILVDLGHLFVNAESVSDVVKEVESMVCHYHIADNMGTSDDHMVPGDGKMDYEIFFKKLKASGYKGFLAVELGFQYVNDPDPAVKRSIDFLKRKFEGLK